MKEAETPHGEGGDVRAGARAADPVRAGAVPGAGQGAPSPPETVKARPSRTGVTGALAAAVAAVRHGVHLAALGALTLVTLALLGGGILLLSLRSEPIGLPVVAELAERVLNANEERRTTIEIGRAELALPPDGQAPKLVFRDVMISEPETGELLMALPAVSARLHMPDLLDGAISATDVEIRGPTAQFVRGIDGLWRFGLGAGGWSGGLALNAPPDAAPIPAFRPRPGADRLPLSAPEADGAVPEPDAPNPENGDTAEGIAAGGHDDPILAGPVPEDPYRIVARLLRGLAGEGAVPRELARLESIRILGARLSYRNAWTGDVWETEDATLRLTRDEAGLTAAIGVRIASGDGAPLRTVRLTLRHDRGATATELDASFRGVRPSRVAVNVPELEWLSVIDAPVDGILSGRLDATGTLSGFGGRIWARAGRFVGTGGEAFASSDFSAMRIGFAYDTRTERLTLDDLLIAADAGEAALSGLIELERGAGGSLRGLVGQLRVDALTLDLPEQFAEPLAFDSGEAVMRVGLAPAAVDIASARLGREDMVLDLSGRLRSGAEGWTSDLRVEGRRVTVADLKTHWPLNAARNARAWVVEHLGSGLIDALVAQVRLGAGEPQLSLDFTYRDLDARYLGDMPPIRGAAGRGSLRLHDFYLEMTEGFVEPVAGKPIGLAGSRVAIRDLWGAVTPAEIEIRGRGPLGAVLTLIDQPPLGLVGKLGLDPSTIQGGAEVTALLDFPLIAALLIEDIDADARASLTGVDMALALPDGSTRAVRSDALTLEASTTEMTIAGAIVADGVPAEIEWRELYGETPGRRTLRAVLTASPALLDRFGVALPAFKGGEADIVLRLSQDGTAPPGFALGADLGRAALALPDIGWRKDAGTAGRMEAEGRISENGAATIERFELSAPGLDAAGSIDISASGTVEMARLKRVRLDERVDLAIEAARVGADGLALTVKGRFLDLAALREALEALESEAEPGAAGGQGALDTDISVDFDVETVQLTPTSQIAGARGTIRTDGAGEVLVKMAGAVNGSAPVQVSLVIPAEGDGKLEIKTEDAGAFLRATGLAEAARDGRMTLSARLIDGRVDRLVGRAKLRDITLREARTVERILRRGGVEQAVEVRSGGLSFNRVDVPFAYRDGVLTLDTSIATGPSLAVKLDGTIVEESGALALSGVISPAYAVTGALNNIPLLGAILSGGEGEGILAMTFVVGGTIDDPSFAVNPLSILTPGFLRKLFTSKARSPDDRFLDGLERED